MQFFWKVPVNRFRPRRDAGPSRPTITVALTESEATEACRRLLAHIRTLSPGGPARKDQIRPYELPGDLLPYICLLDVLPGGRYRFRLFGTALVDAYGSDATGRMLSEIETGESLEHAHDVCRQVVVSRQPVLTRISFETGLGPIVYDRVVLPLVDAAGEVRWLMALIRIIEGAERHSLLAGLEERLLAVG